MQLLTRFLRKLRGETLSIELKNGDIVHGIVVSVDSEMNTRLRGVKMTSRNSNETLTERMTVRGSNIRSYELPDTLPLERMLVDDRKKIVKKKNAAKKKRENPK